MKKIANASRCSICFGDYRFYRVTTLSTGRVAEACWDCYQKERKKTPYQPGYIYIIGHDEFWKVGKTQGKPETRLKELQVGNPHPLQVFDSWLVRDCCIAERFAHSAIRQFHYRGEWFKGDPAQMATLMKQWKLGI
jgi:hypothetical protein